MAFRWRGSDPPRSPGAVAVSPAAPPEGLPCASLAYVLERVLREPRPEVLDQGSQCGQTAVYLAGRGAKVHVDPFDPPPRLPPPPPDQPAPEPPRLRIEQPDDLFDLVLAWELADFVPPERLVEYGAELARIIKPGGWLLLFSHAKPPSDSEPLPRYRVLGEDRVVREAGEAPARRRWLHPNRDLERALAGFTIQKMHLQRTQMRELIALRATSRR